MKDKLYDLISSFGGNNGDHDISLRVRYLDAGGFVLDPRFARQVGLIKDQVYLANTISIGSSYSYFRLDGFPNNTFNTVMFEILDGITMGGDTDNRDLVYHERARKICKFFGWTLLGSNPGFTTQEGISVCEKLMATLEECMKFKAEAEIWKNEALIRRKFTYIPGIPSQEDAPKLENLKKATQESDKLLSKKECFNGAS